MKLHAKLQRPGPSSFIQEDYYFLLLFERGEPRSGAIFYPRAIIRTILIEVHKMKHYTY